MEKGQGALEYLLLIGGAVLIAAIVIALLTGLGPSAACETAKKTVEAACNGYLDQYSCESVGSNCSWDTDEGKCHMKSGYKPPECE